MNKLEVTIEENAFLRSGESATLVVEHQPDGDLLHFGGKIGKRDVPPYTMPLTFHDRQAPSIPQPRREHKLTIDALKMLGGHPRFQAFVKELPPRISQ